MTQMMRFEHGGDIYTHDGVVDFSANINPLGMPSRVVDALRSSIESFEAYPDPVCRELRAAIAQVEGVPVEYIVCTAGATDLMHRVCTALRPAQALVTAPCFSGYEQALEQSGATIVRHPLDEAEDFHLTESFLDSLAAVASSASETSPIVGKVNEAGPGECDSPAADPSVLRYVPRSAQEASAPPGLAAASAASAFRQESGTIIFLCTPNNPTGLTIERELLVRILDAAAASGTLVVLDECFLDFTDEPSAVELCPQYPNMVVMRAFTKMYAMAGLRLGYGICSDEALVERLHAVGQPWTVSTPAQVAGVAALGEPQWIERTRVYVAEQRALLVRGLKDAGMRVIPGQANYLLFQSRVRLFEPMLQRGFLIRRCANYVGLDESWYRIAVRTADENAAFLAALQEVLQ